MNDLKTLGVEISLIFDQKSIFTEITITSFSELILERNINKEQSKSLMQTNGLWAWDVFMCCPVSVII